MKKWKVIIPTLALTAAMSVTAFAATYSGPAAIVADVTGVPETEVTAQRTAGETYGQIAAENGVLEQFKEKMLEWKFEIIDQRVQEERLTTDQAAELKQAMQERAADCTGTPDADHERLGQQLGGGLRFGGMGGNGNSSQQRMHTGGGNGFRRGGR